MDITTAIEIRHSVRKFTKEVISKKDLNKLIWAGMCAPYASGGPRREFYIVTAQSEKDKIMKACSNQPYVGEANAIIVVCGTDTQTKLRSGFQKFVHDCDAAATTIILQATGLGIGSCWIGHFQSTVIKNILKIDYRPTVLILLGYERL